MAVVREGKPRATLQMCGRDYEFDFERMIQYNTETRKERPIRFVEYHDA